MKRLPITTAMKVDALLHWNMCRCRICDERLDATVALDWDHVQPLSRGGEHHYRNIRPVHRECHKRKAFHPRSLATTLCGDNFEAKKTARMAKGGKKRRGPKMKGRGFRKDIRRKFDGTVEKR